MSYGPSSTLSLAYTGVNATTPPNVFLSNRAPTSTDWHNQIIGNIWVDQIGENAYILVSLANNSAVWNIAAAVTGDLSTLTGNSGGAVGPTATNINIVGDGSTVDVVGNPGTSTLTITAMGIVPISFPTDSGTATPAAGILNVSGGTNINTSGSGDTVTINLDDPITLTSATIGGITLATDDITAAAALTIDAGTNTITIGPTGAVKTVNIGSSTGSSQVIIESGTNGIAIGTTSNSHTVTIGSTTGTSATNLNAGTGGIALSTNDGQILLSSLGNTITIDPDGGIVNISTDANASTTNISSGAANKTTILGSTNSTSTTTIQSGTGGIALNAAGALSAQPATNSTSTATSTINSRLSVSTFTGFTTAGAASQNFTISNTTISATSGLIVTCTNLNASTNGALMQIQGITQAASSIVVSTKNVAGGALGTGDNVLITVWVIS